MKHVLDASATLAVIFEETGADAVAMALRSGAEVSARLHQDRWTDPEVALAFDALGIELLPFGSEAAILSGTHRGPELAATRSGRRRNQVHPVTNSHAPHVAALTGKRQNPHRRLLISWSPFYVPPADR